MIIRAIKKDSNGHSEFCFGHGYSDYLHENYEVAQDVESAILEFKNDCFFALDNGIDWRTRLGYHNQKELLDEDIINLIQNRYGVVSIQSFESYVIDRAYTATISIYTIFSQEPLTIDFTQGL